MKSNTAILSAEEWNDLQVGGMVVVEHYFSPTPCLIDTKRRYTVCGVVYLKDRTERRHQIMCHEIIKILKQHEKMKIMLTR